MGWFGDRDVTEFILGGTAPPQGPPPAAVHLLNKHKNQLCSPDNTASVVSIDYLVSNFQIWFY